jgi:iron-sulfur cluster assembly accessory protein
MKQRIIEGIITVTKEGSKELLNMAKTHNTDKIFFKVKGGGCNGFNYSLKPFNGKIEKGDELVNFPEFGIIVCKHSVFHLLGTEIDYQRDLMGSRFVFNNPKARAQCGCGTSFSI